MKGKVPCCTPCSCLDNCWGLGNCCPDKELIGHSAPELKCALAMVKEPGITEYNGYNYGIPRYRIVSSCPNEENNKTLVDKCASKNKTSILDYTWVTDESTGMIFQNEYCARCHNVDRYFKWQIRTTYRSVLSANFSSLPNSIHAPYCELIMNYLKIECIRLITTDVIGQTVLNVTLLVGGKIMIPMLNWRVGHMSPQ